MTRSLITFCLLFVAVFVGGNDSFRISGDRAERIIAGFDTPESLGRWQVRSQGTPTEAKVVPGGTRFFLPASKMWPALHTTGTQLPGLRGIDNFDFLTIDVDNQSSRRSMLKLEIRTAAPDGSSERVREMLDLPPGRHTKRLPLNGDLKTREVKEFYLWQNQPAFDSTFIIANLRVETLPLPEKQSQLRAMIARCRLTEAERRSAPELAGKIDALHELRIADNFPALFAQMDLVRALQREVDQLGRASAAAQFKATAKDGTVGWGWANGIDRIYRDEQRFPGVFGGGSIDLARGESEGAQLCLYAVAALKNVRLTATDFRTAEGAELPASHLEIAPVGYVDMRKMSYFTEQRTGWTPDPILDYLKQFDVEQGKVQPVWIDVEIPDSQTPGLYQGMIELRADGVDPIHIPLAIRVRKFVLPYKNTLPVATASRFDDSYFDHFYGDGNPETVTAFRAYLNNERELDSLPEAAKEMVEVMHRFEKMVARHRIPNDHIYRPRPIRPDDLVRYLADRNTLVCLFAVEKNNTPEQIVEWMDRLAPMIEKNNWWDNVYVYGFDEINPQLFQKALETFRPLKKKYPQLKVMTTAFDYSLGAETGLDEVIDIWVPQIREYFRNSAENAAARAKGHQVWYYTCCYPSPPVVNWLLESEPISTRLMLGFLPWKSGAQGYLNWALLRWKANREVIENGKKTVREKVWDHKLAGGPLTNSDGKGFYNFNGDGFIFYPGESGPVPTVRARLTRDGIEDYEYLALLAQRLEEVESGKRVLPDSWKKRAEAELKIENEIIRHESNYTRCGDELLAKRVRLAELLDESEQ